MLDPFDAGTNMLLHESAHFVVAVRLASQAPSLVSVYPHGLRISAKRKSGAVHFAMGGIPSAIFLGAGVVMAEHFDGKTYEHQYHDKWELNEILQGLPTGHPWTYKTVLAIAAQFIAIDWTIIEAAAACLIPLKGELGSKRTQELVDLVRSTHPANLSRRTKSYSAPLPPGDCPGLKLTDTWPYAKLLPG